MNRWRSTTIFILALLMIAALFSSRAVLSATIIAFCLLSFFHTEPLKQWKRFISSPMLWGMSLLFFVPLISGLWSDDQEEWKLMILIKLPLFLLPLAFAAPDLLSKRQLEWIAWFFIGVILIASCWSFLQYMENSAQFAKGYLQAKTIPTPLEDDHVRFSWLVSVAVFFCLYLLFTKENLSKTLFIISTILLLWFTIYLHILAARTGILSLYIILTGGLICFASSRVGLRKALMGLMLIILLPLIAYFTFPTFQNKIRYFIYDLNYFKNTEYIPGTNDAVRVISVKAGWEIMNASPFNGVGFGDIIQETRNWYQQHYPAMLEADKIYPSSAWMLYGAGAGWPGFLLFALSMLLPFLFRNQQKIMWSTLSISATVSLLFDPALEVQFGVFAYSFIMLFTGNWLQTKDDELSMK